ncbi:CPSF A subunit region protein, partial [Cardiosporidium cionae]
VLYHEESGLLVVACAPIMLPPNSQSSVGLIRFYHLESFELEFEFELTTSCTIASLCCMELNLLEKHLCIVAGTTDLIEKELDPSEGRILLFEIFPSAQKGKCVKLRDVSTDLGGCVSFVHPYKDRILAAVNNKLAIYLPQSSKSLLNTISSFSRCILHSEKLQCEAWHSTNVWITGVDVKDEIILVGDVHSSVSVFRYDSSLKAFTELCRDNKTLWTMDVCCLTPDLYLVTDSFCNFTLFKRNKESPLSNDRARLAVVGMFHHSESINRFIPGSLSSCKLTLWEKKSLAMKGITPAAEYLWGSAEGGMGVVLSLKGKKQFQRFLFLQKAICSTVVGFGDLNHEQWRNFHNESGTLDHCGFIDGNLIEYFLLFPQVLQVEIFESLQSILAEENSIPLYATLQELIEEIQDLQGLH